MEYVEKNKNGQYEVEASDGQKIAWLLVLIPLSILQAWVGSILWAWFIVPMGVPALSVPQAIGIGLMIALFMPSTKKVYSNDYFLRASVASFVNSLITLAFAFVLVQFM